MKKIGIVLLPALFVYAAPAPTPAPGLNPGVVFQVETTYHSGSGSGSHRSEMSVEKPNLKMEILRGSDAEPGEVKDEVIWRGDRREMVVVDHRDKSYMVIDGKAVEEMGKQLGEAQKLVQGMKIPDQVLENMTKEQREQLEKLRNQQGGAGGAAMGGPAGPTREFRKTGERGTKQGYPVVRYDVLRDGEKIRELWVTDWDNITGSREVVGVFGEMASFFNELMDSFGEMAGSGGFFGADGNPLEDFTKVGGFPVVTRSFEGGELESETVLESVTERDLDPDAFEPPKGYRLRTMGPQ